MSVPSPLTVISVVPQLIDALVTTARANAPTGVTVYDGFGVSQDPGDFLMIGVDDPNRADAASSASSRQDWANANYTSREEEGDVTCAALSWNGDSGDAGQKAARDAVYAIAGALAGSLRADPSLGVDGVLWTSFGTSTDLQQNQDKKGSLALLVFQIHFLARI